MTAFITTSHSSETVRSLDPDVLRSPEPSAGRQMAAAVHSPEDQKICGFSNEISPKTFSKNEQLKNIIRQTIHFVFNNNTPQKEI